MALHFRVFTKKLVTGFFIFHVFTIKNSFMAKNSLSLINEIFLRPKYNLMKIKHSSYSLYTNFYKLFT